MARFDKQGNELYEGSHRLCTEEEKFDGSHVAMLVCPICQQPTSIVMSTRIENGKLVSPFKERQYVKPDTVCLNCQEKYLNVGVMLINPKSCNLVVISVECFTANFSIPIPEGHIVYAEDDLIALITKSYQEANPDAS